MRSVAAGRTLETEAYLAQQEARRGVHRIAACLGVSLLISCGGNTQNPPPPENGTLAVNVSGLPSGANASVAITGPNSFSQSLTASQSLTVSTGAYAVTASNVTSGSNTYSPAVTGSPATVAAGQTSTVSVAYLQVVVQTTGSLNVSISGVSTADVTISGPAGYSHHLTASATMTSLTPGTYTIDASDVGNYTAQVTGSPATVAAGSTANVSVIYSPTVQATGNLQIDINGNSGGQVSITGPSGYFNSLTSSQLITGLTPGNYTITAGDVTGYTHSVAGSPATVTSGTTADVTVTYTSVTGTLIVKVISGNPPSGNLTVSGPDGYFRSITVSSVSLTVPAGSYTVTGTPYNSNSITYSPTPPADTVDVAVAGTTEVDIAFLPPAPTATSLSPNYGIPGSSCAVVGTNFINDANTVVNFGSTQITPSLAFGTVVQFNIPSSAAPGDYPVSVTTSGGTSSSLNFNVYVVDVFSLPTQLKNAAGIGFLVGPDGNFWFVDQSEAQIGTMTPDGTATAYAPSGEMCFSPWGLAVGSDGNLWFGSTCKPRLGRITTAGAFTFFDVPNGCIPYALTSGPGGLLWIGTGNCGAGTAHDGVDTFDPAGGATSFVEYPYSSAAVASTRSIALGYDGDLWVTKSFSVSHVSTIGTWATDASDLNAETPIFKGPNGHMWYGGNDYVAEIDESGTITYGHNGCGNGNFPNGAMIYDSASGLIWCWSLGSGPIASYNAGANKQIAYPWAPLNGTETWGVTQDASGEVWFYTDSQNSHTSAISHLRTH
jgi:hypothetical protein